MEGLIQGAFARALEAGRPRFNALFAQARHANPQLDVEAFTQHLCSTVAPIVEEVYRVAPLSTSGVAEVLFELSLQLVGKDLLGPRARCPVLAEGWWMLLSELPHHLAAAPRSFAASVTNALYNLTLYPDSRAREWIEGMLRIGPECPDLSSFLEVGKVLGWRAGLAHYREGALEVCKRIPPSLACKALGISESNCLQLGTILHPLQGDPWLLPASAGQVRVRQLGIVRVVGAFRGFGGLFPRPPRVIYREEQLLVHDGETWWVLHADLFGATLHRLGPEAPGGDGGGAFQIDRKGNVSYQSWCKTFPELKEWSSFASSESTLAVTLPLSHCVYLVALAEK